MLLRCGLLLVALVTVAACKSDPGGDATAESARATSAPQLSPPPSTSSRAASTVAPVTSAPTTTEASLARPERITFAPLFVFPREAETRAIRNGVVACDRECAAAAGPASIRMWFVDRARVVEDPNLQPYSASFVDQRRFSFGGAYPDALYASVSMAEDRVGLSVPLAFDGKLYQATNLPPNTFLVTTEAPATPEVLAELDEKRPASAGFRVAYGAGGPAIVSDEAGVRARVDGKLQKVALPAQREGVRGLHRLENGYTLVAWPHHVVVLDQRAKRVPLQVDGAELEADLASARYSHFSTLFVGGEAWISAVLDHGKPTARTVLLATSPGLFTGAHLRTIDTEASPLTAGGPRWKGEWKPSAPPPP